MSKAAFGQRWEKGGLSGGFPPPPCCVPWLLVNYSTVLIQAEDPSAYITAPDSGFPSPENRGSGTFGFILVLLLEHPPQASDPTPKSVTLEWSWCGQLPDCKATTSVSGKHGPVPQNSGVPSTWLTSSALSSRRERRSLSISAEQEPYTQASGTYLIVTILFFFF